jgi:hypothetical protein
MTFVIRALPGIVMEFRMGRMVMKQMFIAVSLLLAFCVGCDEGQDRQLPQDRQLRDGTKLFGTRTLKDGTENTDRVELPNGKKEFDVTELPDGTMKAGRIELANGEKQFDVTRLSDGPNRSGALNSQVVRRSLR